MPGYRWAVSPAPQRERRTEVPCDAHFPLVQSGFQCRLGNTEIHPDIVSDISDIFSWPIHLHPPVSVKPAKIYFGVSRRRFSAYSICWRTFGSFSLISNLSRGSAA